MVHQYVVQHFSTISQIADPSSLTLSLWLSVALLMQVSTDNQLKAKANVDVCSPAPVRAMR